MLTLDKTFLIQIAVFFILFYLLNRFLYRPIMAVLDERKKKTEGAFKDAADREEEISRGLGDYERRLKEASIKAQEELSVLRREILEKGKEVVERARLEAEEEFLRLKDELVENREMAAVKLREETPRLSKTIVEKLLERSLLVIFAVFLLIPAAALAEEAGEHGGGSGFYWKVFNFVLLVIAVYFIWRKKLKGLFVERSAGIKKAIADAEEKKNETEAKYKEYQEKLGQLDIRLEEIRRNIRLEAEAEKKRIIEEGEEMVRELKEQARFSASQELKKAKEELRNEVATLAVEFAKEMLKREIRIEDHDRIVSGCTEKLKLN